MNRALSVTLHLLMEREDGTEICDMVNAETSIAIHDKMSDAKILSEIKKLLKETMKAGREFKPSKIITHKAPALVM